MMIRHLHVSYHSEYYIPRFSGIPNLIRMLCNISLLTESWAFIKPKNSWYNVPLSRIRNCENKINVYVVPAECRTKLQFTNCQ
jgi:hypothetical protein